MSIHCKKGGVEGRRRRREERRRGGEEERRRGGEEERRRGGEEQMKHTESTVRTREEWKAISWSGLCLIK